MLVLQGSQIFQVPASRIDVWMWVCAMFIWAFGSCPELALLSPFFREISVEHGFLMHQSECRFSQPLFHSFFFRVNKTGLKWDLSIVKSTGDGWPQGMLISKGVKIGGRWETHADWLTFKFISFNKILHAWWILVEWFKNKEFRETNKAWVLWLYLS